MTRGICPNCGSWADFGIAYNDWQVTSSSAFGTIYKCPHCYHKANDKDIKKYNI